MNERFTNHSNMTSLIIDERGITVHDDTLGSHVFYPFGSINELKMGLVLLTIQGGKYVSYYKPVGDQKQKIKQIIPSLRNMNVKASKCEPVVIDMAKAEDTKIEKSVDSIVAYFDGFKSNKMEMMKFGISNIVNSMDADEEIIYGFKGSMLYINGPRNCITDYIGLISNKKFYYAGSEGNAHLPRLKEGTIELKDVHAISMGDQTMSFPPFVQFEVLNENYKMGTHSNIQKIKETLESAVKACKEKAAATINYSAVSAADELKKFKELLDMGVITQEEFNAKKKQLLGL